MSERKVECSYSDPLDLIWLRAAERLGMRVQRSEEVYASWDGQDTLSIASPSHFDADDSLAQMIFHELCHALVAGDKRHELDWGLSNTDGRDLVYEHACHRLQAALADPFGLRAFFAVTTEWRPYWDALPEDPLADDGDPAVPIAQRAHYRSQQAPWNAALEEALRATAALAEVVRPWAPERSLWARTRPRHSTGFVLHESENLRCGACTWSFTARGSLRCRRSKTPDGLPKRVGVDERACDRWERRLTALDCASCGACCREGFDVVQVRPKERFVLEQAQLVERSSLGLVVPRPNGRCVALVGEGTGAAPYRCAHYEARPRSCAEFPISGEACLLARRRAGVSR